MATITTEEDEMVHNGEALPILSASAKTVSYTHLTLPTTG